MQIRSLLGDVVALISTSLPEIQSLRHRVSWKPDGSPVTEADVYLEGLISAFLEARLPGVHVIGEESFDGAQISDPTGWVALIDPVDGTENFCSGLKEWGVALTIWRDGQHVGSLLHLPELNEHLMTGDTIAYQNSRIVGLSSTVTPETIDALQGILEARILGCAVYNLFNVTRGALARFINPRGAYSWDLQAGIMLAMEHGCEVSIDGKPYDGRFLEAGRRYRVDIQHRHDLHPGQGTVG
ncbi:inositol monophosphatase family protein [Xanthobacter sediminis]